MHHLAQQGFEVYGADHSQSAITSCQQWLRSKSLSAELWCGEMEEIPYPDQIVDAIVAFNSIYHGTSERLDGVMRLLRKRTPPPFWSQA